MGHKSNPISVCACRSTAPGTAAGTPKGVTMRSCSRKTSAIRKYIMENLPQAAISKVVIEAFRPKLCRVIDLRRASGCHHLARRVRTFEKAALQACHHGPRAR